VYTERTGGPCWHANTKVQPLEKHCKTLLSNLPSSAVVPAQETARASAIVLTLQKAADRHLFKDATQTVGIVGVEPLGRLAVCSFDNDRRSYHGLAVVHYEGTRHYDLYAIGTGACDMGAVRVPVHKPLLQAALAV